MRIIPHINTLRKGILLYRSIRYRKGFGVHSPFVFTLITRVIEEKCPYYHFQNIELIRKQLNYREEKISYPDRKKKGKRRTRTIGQIVTQEAIRPKHGALLFRLTNYFQSKQILQLGPAMGLSTLYLTSYASDLKCIALENIPEFATIARISFEKAARNPIDLRIGDYRTLLPEALKAFNHLDFVFFNTLYELSLNEWFFETCLSHINDNTIFVFEGIKANKTMRTFWKKVCEHPRVTVTIDLYSMGIIFFTPRLHKRNYIVYF